MSDEWRNLGPEDNFQEGDEWAEKGKDRWTLVASNCFGDRIGYLWDRVYDFRRRVAVKEQQDPLAERDMIQWDLDQQSKVVKVLTKELSEMKQRAEKAEAKLAQYFDALMRSEREIAETRPKFTQAEKELEAAELALREIYMALGNADPADGEEVSREDVVRAVEEMKKERDEARRKFDVVTGKLAYYHTISGTQHDGSDVDLEVCSLCGYADGHDDDCFVQRLEGLYEAEDELRQAEKERDQLRDECEERRIAMADIVRDLGFGCGGLEHQEIAPKVRKLRDENAGLREALEKIANHPFISYDRAQGGIYEGQYGIGVVDGHRACSTIAQQALAAKGETK